LRPAAIASKPGARGPAGWRTEDEPRVRRLENLLGQPLLWCERRAEAFEFAFSPLKLGVHSLCPLGERLDESRLRRNIIWCEGPGLAGLIGKLVLSLHPLALSCLPIVLVADTVPLARSRRTSSTSSFSRSAISGCLPTRFVVGGRCGEPNAITLAQSGSGQTRLYAACDGLPRWPSSSCIRYVYITRFWPDDGDPKSTDQPQG
jgi:hypothetical protein